MERKVTLATIAEDAGVSKATVSLVVRDSPLVAEETRAKVLASIERLGYVYNRAAARLRSRKTGTVGLIVASIANPFSAELVAGIETKITEHGRTLLFTQHSESLASQKRQIEVMLENRVDGVLVMAALGTPEDHLARLRAAGIPVVLVSRRVSGALAPYVGSDNQGGARKAGEHLLEHGARRITMLGGFAGSSPFLEREEGLVAALAVAGGTGQLSTVPAPPTRDAAYDAARELVKRREKRPDAIFAYNDNVAIGALAALTDAGVQVGEEIRVVGFDDVLGARYTIPPLTTVHSRPALIGSIAGEKLLAYMDDGEADGDVVIPNSLSVRASCGCHYDGGSTS